METRPMICLVALNERGQRTILAVVSPRTRAQRAENNEEGAVIMRAPQVRPDECAGGSAKATSAQLFGALG